MTKDMSPSENIRHQARKSQQTELPIIKFRSSCDLCTEAKVRCDKKHPQCSRCIRIGSTCRYSVSMRSRKPTIEFVKALNIGSLLMPPHWPAQTIAHRAGALDSDQCLRAILQAGHNHSLGSMANSSTLPSSDLTPSPVPIRPFQDQDSNPVLKTGWANSNPPFQALPTSQNDGIGLQLGQSTDSPSHHPIDATNYLYRSSDNFTLLEVEAQSLGSPLSISPAMDFDCYSQFELSEPGSPRIREITKLNGIDQGANDRTVSVDPDLQQPRTLLYGHSCLYEVKTLLNSVTMMASRGEMRQYEHSVLASTLPIMTTDQALAMCSSISKNLIEILRCRCEADAHLPFLITVTISKVLATYGAIAKVDDSTAFKFGSIPKTPKEEQDAFVAVPFRLGAYEVDRELEGVLRAQLVLHELSRLDCVVQLFAEKYCQSLGDEKLSEDRTIYSALGRFIEQRYARMKAACELKRPLWKSGS